MSNTQNSEESSYIDQSLAHLNTVVENICYYTHISNWTPHAVHGVYKCSLQSVIIEGGATMILGPPNQKSIYKAPSHMVSCLSREVFPKDSYLHFFSTAAGGASKYMLKGGASFLHASLGIYNNMAYDKENQILEASGFNETSKYTDDALHLYPMAVESIENIVKSYFEHDYNLPAETITDALKGGATISSLITTYIAADKFLNDQYHDSESYGNQIYNATAEALEEACENAYYVYENKHELFSNAIDYFNYLTHTEL
jgi:hypothetical protein